jgi:type I restriction enzyme, S subunit
MKGVIDNGKLIMDNVSQLPKGWEIKKLGELGKVSMCKRILKKETSPEGDIPFYKIGTFGKMPNAFISKIVYEEYRSKYSFPKKGDILLSASGTIGRRVIYDGKPAYFQDSNIVWIDNNEEEVLNEYLYKFYGFCNWNPSKGATISRLYNDDLRKIQIPIPPLPEQKRIVSILDRAFSLIERSRNNAEQNLKNANELFESYLQGVFESKGDDWEEKPLSELCMIKHGFAFKSQYFSNEGIYVLLTPGNFYEAGGYRNRKEKQKYYIGEIPNGYILKKGDLLVAMTEQAAGLLGSPILVPDSNTFLHNQRLGLILPNEDSPWINEFFFHVFNTRIVRQILHSTGTGIKVRHTSPTKIGDVIVRFPSSIKVQETIVEKLNILTSETKRLEAIYQQKIDNLEELKKSVLQKAFAGQLRIDS